jgi:chromosomal replication initiation ATPase DnaA
MYFGREYTDLFLHEIGEYFSKGHCDVIYGVMRVRRRLLTDPIFKNELRQINIKIRESINETFNKYENYETDKC